VYGFLFVVLHSLPKWAEGEKGESVWHQEDRAFKRFQHYYIIVCDVFAEGWRRDLIPSTTTSTATITQPQRRQQHRRQQHRRQQHRRQQQQQQQQQQRLSLRSTNLDMPYLDQYFPAPEVREETIVAFAKASV
jgi:hypothetical protein